MSENKVERFEMRASQAFLERIDKQRRRDPSLPSRAEMIRILCDEAISHRSNQKKKEDA
jgi:metal-responsive CopG/Arc/MetJ family transcriptional regulator